jgi:cobaltochelatase CobS
MMYSGTFKPRIDSAEARALREALTPLIDFLPSASDRRMASDICTKSVTLGMTSAQAHWVRQFVAKAQKFAASGRKGSEVVDADIWGSASDSGSGSGSATAAPSGSVHITLRAVELIQAGQIIEAIKEVRDTSGCSLREAKDAVETFVTTSREASTTQASTSTAMQQQQVVEIGADDLQAALKRVVDPALTAIAQQVETNAQTRQRLFNEGAARAIADEATRRALAELDSRVPREVIVRVERGDVTRSAEGRQHPNFELLCRAASIRVNGHVPGIMLAGEAGSGKTTGARNLASAFGLAWHFNGAISFPHEMLGFIDAGGRYHRTPFREAYEHGGVYTFDEVDRSDPVALLSVNPHLANGLATFPDGQIKRHEDCIIVATANTWGHGADANYSGATKLDAAFLSRFPVKIAWDIDERLEDDIVSNAEWLLRVRSARKRAQQVGLKVIIDTRHGQAGAQLIAQGFTHDEAASMTYLAGLKPDQRKQVEGGK